MRQRRPRVNIFLVAVLIALIVMVTYVDRVILPNAHTIFLPTLTATQQPEALADQAARLFDQGKLLNSIDSYLEAIRIQPENSALYISLARVQIFAGKYDEALVNTENSLLLNNNNAMAYALRGWALTNKLDYDGADTSLKKAMQMDPSSGPAHAYTAFLYGKMYENQAGPYPDPIQTAIDESNTAISLAPNSLEAHWARAYILTLTSSDNLELAVEQYQDAIAINKNISEIHLELGVTYRLLQSMDLALQEYTLADTLNPSDYRPEMYSSRADSAIGENDKALQWAEKAIQDAPTDANLRGNWGYMFYKKSQLSDAITQLALAIEGGTTSDGLTIKAITPNASDDWVRKYYYAYAISLATQGECARTILITQKIRNLFASDPYSGLNADYAENICAEGLLTPTAPPADLTPTATP